MTPSGGTVVHTGKLLSSSMHAVQDQMRLCRDGASKNVTNSIKEAQMGLAHSGIADAIDPLWTRLDTSWLKATTLVGEGAIQTSPSRHGPGPRSEAVAHTGRGSTWWARVDHDTRVEGKTTTLSSCLPVGLPLQIVAFHFYPLIILQIRYIEH
jgi:hypothetical protein